MTFSFKNFFQNRPKEPKRKTTKKPSPVDGGSKTSTTTGNQHPKWCELTLKDLQGRAELPHDDALSSVYAKWLEDEIKPLEELDQASKHAFYNLLEHMAEIRADLKDLRQGVEHSPLEKHFYIDN